MEVGFMDFGKLILLRRCWQLLVPLTILFIIYAIWKHKYGESFLVGLIIYVLLAGFISWFDCFRWHALTPLTLEYRSTVDYQFRRDDGRKIIPEDYTWYPIDPKPVNNDQIIQRVMNRYIREGGTFDFENYRYLAVYGYTMEALYRLEGRMLCTCVAVHGYDCLSNEILIYKIPFTYIEPGEDRTIQDHYIFL